MHIACTPHAHPPFGERSRGATVNVEITPTQETHMRRIVTLTLAALSLTALVACQTTEGFGQDVENTGEAIQGAAN